MDRLPAINAMLNAVSTVLLFSGYGAMRKQRIPLHRACMIAACIVSALFLVGYVSHKVLLHEATGQWNTVFGGQGAIRTVYLVVLATHVVLAMALPFLVPVTLIRGLAKRFDKHRSIARVTFPIWLYVSVTGVLVYFMLYQWYPTS